MKKLLVASLTETAYYSRKVIKFGAIGIVAFLIVRMVFLAGVAYWRKLHPPPPPPPTVAFGKLPKLIFPDEEQPAVTYRLETVTGTTPDLGDRANVFFMPVKQANLLALDKMKTQAKKLDFIEEPDQLSPRRYQWTRDLPIPASLTADIVSGSFSLEVSWYQDPLILSNKNLPDKTKAVDEAQKFLQNAGLLPPDLLTGNSRVSFLKADIDEMVEVSSLSEADFVRVDFFRANVNDLVVYTPHPDRGVVSLIFSGLQAKGKRVVQLKYNYFPVTYEQTATYPIKSSLAAWNELQAGEGYIADLEDESLQVVVRRISLGYYDSAIPQHYLQPIYVFEGDSDFVAYVPAIDPAWVE